jgi:hypothetical protein
MGFSMAKAPKVEETKAGKLRLLRAIGLTENKTFSKSASRAWDHFITEFPHGKPPKNSLFIKVSPEAKRACASVNIRVVGDFIAFPVPPGGSAKIRETKHGVFLDYGRKGAEFKNNQDTIILAKDLNHIKYGMKIAKRQKARDDANENTTAVYGTLKTHAYGATRTGEGEMIKGFMRDVARTYDNPLDALLDDRYAADKTNIAGSHMVITADFVDKLHEKNGVAALIMTRL